MTECVDAVSADAGFASSEELLRRRDFFSETISAYG